MAAWSIYMLRCGDGTLYTGIATDVRRRLAEHLSHGGRGAKYLRGRGPLELVLQRRVGPRALALRVEARIKRLPRARKEHLLSGRRELDRLVSGARRGMRLPPGRHATART